MDVGVHLPNIGIVASGPDLARLGLLAEELGFHSVWFSDHVVLPTGIEPRYPYNDTGQFAPPTMPWVECLTSMAFVAGATQRIKIGSSVLIVPYRHAVVLGAQVSALQYLSGGRLILGVGVGWMKEEFDIMGVPYEERGPRLDESLDVITAMCSSSPAEFHGRFFDLPEAGTAPLPESPPEIWIGGNTPVALRRAARHAGWHGFQLPPEEVRKAAGKLPRGVRVSVRTTLNRDDMKSTVADVEQLGDAGADHVVLDVWGEASSIETQLRRFAADFLPALQA